MFGDTVRNQHAFVQNNLKKWMELMKHDMSAVLVFENMSKELKTLRPPCDNSVTPCRDMLEFPKIVTHMAPAYVVL